MRDETRAMRQRLIDFKARKMRRRRSPTSRRTNLQPLLRSQQSLHVAFSKETVVMMRILTIPILSALLASCSGSSRLADTVPDWANTRPSGAVTQYATPDNHSQGRDTLAAERRGTPAAQPRGAPAAEPRGTPAAEPQEGKKAEVQSPSEE